MGKKRGQRKPSSQKKQLYPNWEDGLSEDSVYVKNNTLLKHVPYEDIEPRAEIKYALRRQRLSKFDSKYYRAILALTGGDQGNRALAAGPVLQVISVTIYKKTDPSLILTAHGNISLTDYKNDTFYVLKNEVSVYGWLEKLSLTEYPIAPVMGGKVKFSFDYVAEYDARLGGGEVNHVFDDCEYDLDNPEEEEEEVINQCVTREFTGSDNTYCARLVFYRIPFAVVANVEMCFMHEPPHYKPGSTFKLCGKILANNIVCWESSEGEDMKYGKLEILHQLVEAFAVPVFSQLHIELSLRINDDLVVDDKLAISPAYYNHYLYRGRFNLKDGNSILSTGYRWGTHANVFHKEGFMSYSLDIKWDQPGVYIPPGIQIPKRPYALVEVFSIVIWNNEIPDPTALRGTIIVLDGQGKFYIFARGKKTRPDRLSSSSKFRTLSLAWPDRWILENMFYMDLRLVDVKNDQVSRGFLSWDPELSRGYDRRICDAIEGKNGYFAAVHYSVFKNGKKAKVTVKCSKDGLYSLVYGTVYASYGGKYNYYPTTYEKECYRIIIFKRPKEECVKVKNCCEMQLSKSHIAAPSDCEELIIDADLCVRPCMSETSCLFERATANFKFKPGGERVQSQVDGCISVDVDWTQKC